MNNNKHLIVLSGPTAVGKTALSIQLSKEFNAPIISCDSRQFYREMTIGTAKPSQDELSQALHYFINIRSVQNPLNAGDFEDLAYAELENIFSKGDVCILTGGSGLFLKAVYQGLDKFPEVSIELREELEKSYAERGIETLQTELKEKDPEYYAKVDLKNPRRLIRALEIIKSSERPYSSFLKQRIDNKPFKSHFILLNRNREELYDRINQRVDQMIKNGLEEEARKLLPFRKLKSLQTVGYQEFFDFFQGLISLEETIELIKRNSRRYAKRQLTWFRGQGEWNEFHPKQIEEIKVFIRKQIELK